MHALDTVDHQLVADSPTLTVLIHGFEGGRSDWRVRDGFSKGGDLTARLDERGMAWLACDLYGHGAWAADEPEFTPEHISDELFPSFVSRSAAAVRDAVEVAAERTAARRLHIVSYSAGCHIAVAVVGLELPLPVTALLLAAPTPERGYDDEYSLHNNLGVFEGRTVALFSGREDDEAPHDDVVWLFDRIPGGSKRRFDYDAGHALPVAWTDDAVAVLADDAPAEVTTAT